MGVNRAEEKREDTTGALTGAAGVNTLSNNDWRGRGGGDEDVTVDSSQLSGCGSSVDGVDDGVMDRLHEDRDDE
jgi:hypothetical protein